VSEKVSLFVVREDYNFLRMLPLPQIGGRNEFIAIDFFVLGEQYTGSRGTTPG
jgi:hypothetical protein